MEFKAKFLCIGGLAAIDFYILHVGFFFFYSFISVLFRKSVISPHDLFFYFFFSLVFDIYKKTKQTTTKNQSTLLALCFAPVKLLLLQGFLVRILFQLFHVMSN